MNYTKRREELKQMSRAELLAILESMDAPAYAYDWDDNDIRTMILELEFSE